MKPDPKKEDDSRNPFGANPYQSSASVSAEPRVHYNYRQPHRGVFVLVMGVGSMCTLFVSFICCLPLNFAACLMGWVAWFVGRADVKKMNEGVVDDRGRDQVLVGSIIGLICALISSLIVLVMLGFLVFIIVVAIGENM